MDDCELIELAPAHTNADWRPEAIQFFDGSKADPAQFENASLSFAMRIVGSNDTPILFTTADGTLTITLPDMVAPTVPRETMAGIPPGEYEWDLVCTFADATVEWLVGGTLPVVGGINP